MLDDSDDYFSFSPHHVESPAGPSSSSHDATRVLNDAIWDDGAMLDYFSPLPVPHPPDIHIIPPRFEGYLTFRGEFVREGLHIPGYEEDGSAAGDGDGDGEEPTDSFSPRSVPPEIVRYELPPASSDTTLNRPPLLRSRPYIPRRSSVLSEGVGDLPEPSDYFSPRPIQFEADKYIIPSPFQDDILNPNCPLLPSALFDDHETERPVLKLIIEDHKVPLRVTNEPLPQSGPEPADYFAPRPRPHETDDYFSSHQSSHHRPNNVDLPKLNVPRAFRQAVEKYHKEHPLNLYIAPAHKELQRPLQDGDLVVISLDNGVGRRAQVLHPHHEHGKVRVSDIDAVWRDKRGRPEKREMVRAVPGQLCVWRVVKLEGDWVAFRNLRTGRWLGISESAESLRTYFLPDYTASMWGCVELREAEDEDFEEYRDKSIVAHGETRRKKKSNKRTIAQVLRWDHSFQLSRARVYPEPKKPGDVDDPDDPNGTEESDLRSGRLHQLACTSLKPPYCCVERDPMGRKFLAFPKFYLGGWKYNRVKCYAGQDFVFASAIGTRVHFMVLASTFSNEFFSNLRTFKATEAARLALFRKRRNLTRGSFLERWWAFRQYGPTSILQGGGGYNVTVNTGEWQRHGDRNSGFIQVERRRRRARFASKKTEREMKAQQKRRDRARENMDYFNCEDFYPEQSDGEDMDYFNCKEFCHEWTDREEQDHFDHKDLSSQPEMAEMAEMFDKNGRGMAGGLEPFNFEYEGNEPDTDERFDEEDTGVGCEGGTGLYWVPQDGVDEDEVDYFNFKGSYQPQRIPCFEALENEGLVELDSHGIRVQCDDSNFETIYTPPEDEDWLDSVDERLRDHQTRQDQRSCSRRNSSIFSRSGKNSDTGDGSETGSSDGSWDFCKSAGSEIL